MHHTFWTKEIPFKLDPNDAVLSAIRCNWVLAKEVIKKDTQWMVIAVWLSMQELGELFMGGCLC